MSIGSFIRPCLKGLATTDSFFPRDTKRFRFTSRPSTMPDWMLTPKSGTTRMPIVISKSGPTDPEGVYSASDGTLHISGEGFGYVATQENYENYHLSVEYRWGKKTDGSGYVRNSGILLHANGPDGNAKGMWMARRPSTQANSFGGQSIKLNLVNWSTHAAKTTWPARSANGPGLTAFARATASRL